jgi:drug/metabolite transporter (DMT)-like permease
MASIGASRAERIKRSLAQSTFITATWTSFMILATKAAEPVLVASVLYASVKLLPLAHVPRRTILLSFSPNSWPWISGVSISIHLPTKPNKRQNHDGASQTWRLSLALVVVMLVGTSQVVFFGVRFTRVANSQSARYDTVFNTSGRQASSKRSNTSGSMS